MSCPTSGKTIHDLLGGYHIYRVIIAVLLVVTVAGCPPPPSPTPNAPEPEKPTKVIARKYAEESSYTSSRFVFSNVMDPGSGRMVPVTAIETKHYFVSADKLIVEVDGDTYIRQDVGDLFQGNWR